MTEPQQQKTSVIYNENNILIERDDINKILLKANIKKRINDIEIWRRAFCHSSYSKNFKKNRKYNGFLQNIDMEAETNNSGSLSIQEESNERLEWLGDSKLQSIISEYLYMRFPKQDEGFLTKIRSKLVKTEGLSKLSRYYGFEKFLIVSKHIEENCNGRNNSCILEDAFEAFLGAMYLDFGANGKAFDICKQFVISSIEMCIDFTELIINDDNYKDQLMRFYQKNFNGKFPVYCQEDFDEETKTFYMYVTHPLSNKIVGKGKAQSKKKAEQLAAQNALKFFKV